MNNLFLFFPSLSRYFLNHPDVSNATAKIAIVGEHSSNKSDEKQSAAYNNKPSSGEKLFIRTVGFGDKAVSTSAPITPSIK